MLHTQTCHLPVPLVACNSLASWFQCVLPLAIGLPESPSSLAIGRQATGGSHAGNLAQLPALQKQWPSQARNQLPLYSRYVRVYCVYVYVCHYRCTAHSGRGSPFGAHASNLTRQKVQNYARRPGDPTEPAPISGG